MTTRMSLFASQQVSGTYADGDYYCEDATFASLPNAKTAAEISQNPSRYLCALGFFSLASLRSDRERDRPQDALSDTHRAPIAVREGNQKHDRCRGREDVRPVESECR